MGQSHDNTSSTRCYDFKILIIESDTNFKEMTLVEPANAIENPRSICIGHIGEMYQIVSTCPVLPESCSNQINNNK